MVDNGQGRGSVSVQVFPPTAEVPIERILVRARVGPHPHVPGKMVVMAKTVASPSLPGGGAVVLLAQGSDALEAYSFGGGLLWRYESQDFSGSFVLSATSWNNALYVLLCRPGQCLLVKSLHSPDQVPEWSIGHRSLGDYDSGVVLPPSLGQNFSFPGGAFIPGVLTGADRMEALVPVRFRAPTGGGPIAFLLSGSGRVDYWKTDVDLLYGLVVPSQNVTPPTRLIPSGVRLVGGLTDNNGYALAFARGTDPAGTFRVGLTLASLELVDLSPSPDPSYDSQERRAGVVDKYFPGSYSEPKSVGWYVRNYTGQSVEVAITLRALEKFWAYGVLWASDGTQSYAPSSVTTSLSSKIREELPYKEASYGGAWGCVFFPAPILVYPGQVFTVSANKVMEAYNEDWLFAGEVGLVGFPAGQIGDSSVLAPQE